MNLNAALADPFIAHVSGRLAVRERVAASADLTRIQAAVAILLRLREPQSPELLLIRRAEFEGDPWSGHIALPGGRQEPGDETLEQTALRETMEEVALDVYASGRVLGCLSDVKPESPRLPRILIRPYVAVVDDEVELVLSSEVAIAFWVPLSELRNPRSRANSIISARDESFSVAGYRLGEHFVWGLTERILREFLEIAGGM